MKVLLLGEYSNVHWTLAQGLRQLGCDVTVVSGGDGFKAYERDINLTRSSNGVVDTVGYLYKVVKNFRSFKGYDVVQIINPFFLSLKPDKNLQAFNYLKRHNGKVFMGAFGDDCYWLRACLDKKTFRYSEFDIPGREGYLDSAKKLIETWSDADKMKVNQEIAEKSDGIIACLYEYYMSYEPYFREKLIYIPEPVNTEDVLFRQRGEQDIVSFFIGIQKHRAEIKGADVMYKALQDIYRKYPSECKIDKAESLPYQQYVEIMDRGDVLLDQLYSYSPAMNGLLAMAKGMVVVGGGEPEIYTLLNEYENFPVVNVVPTEEDVYNKLEYLILNKNVIRGLSYKSRSFIEKHHDYRKVAKQYLEFWNKER